MIISQTGPKSWKLAAAVSAMALLGPALANMAMAQSRVTPLINPTGTPKPAAPAGAVAADAAASSETAVEDKLMGQLASREMDSLLTYYFQKHSIAPERQDVI